MFLMDTTVMDEKILRDNPEVEQCNSAMANMWAADERL